MEIFITLNLPHSTDQFNRSYILFESNLRAYRYFLSKTKKLQKIIDFFSPESDLGGEGGAVKVEPDDLKAASTTGSEANSPINVKSEVKNVRPLKRKKASSLRKLKVIGHCGYLPLSSLVSIS